MQTQLGLSFGTNFTDHMFKVKWNYYKGWDKPIICPIGNLSLHPASLVFHYAQELFEGMKAFRGIDGRIRLFRPDLNMKRMRQSAKRVVLPDFEGKELIECMKRLIAMDADWVPPYGSEASLYIRPTLIATEEAIAINPSLDALLYIICSPVGSYFANRVANPISLLADPRFVRASPGGIGESKLGANYGPTLAVQKMAEKMGLEQVLWLYGEDHQLTEAGAMNVFVYLVDENGDKELVTPPLQQGLILPGVTRLSFIELSQTWTDIKVTERKITMTEVKRLVKDKRLLEIFIAGTACIVCPVGRIRYMNEDILIPTQPNSQSLQSKLYNILRDIQYGRVEHEWSVLID